MVVFCGLMAVGAHAQNKTEVTPTRVVKVESKQALQRATPPTKKVSATTLDSRSVQVKRVEGKEAGSIILTEEKKNIRSTENAAKPRPQKTTND